MRAPRITPQSDASSLFWESLIDSANSDPHLCFSRRSGATWNGALEAASGARPRMMSEAFSPIMIVGAWRLPDVVGHDRGVDDAQALEPDHAR
jgi:hypothetical protein